MKAIKNPVGKDIFRNKIAILNYDKKIGSTSFISEHGVDTCGNIYFSWMNGSVERYTRSEFISNSIKEIHCTS